MLPEFGYSTTNALPLKKLCLTNRNTHTEFFTHNKILSTAIPKFWLHGTALPYDPDLLLFNRIRLPQPNSVTKVPEFYYVAN
jgi:hypothetical protein